MSSIAKLDNSKLKRIGWLKSSSFFDKKALLNFVNRGNPRISIKRQCELLKLNRSTFYYEKRPKKGEDQLISMLEECYQEFPFYGIRKRKVWFEREYGAIVNEKAIARLIRKTGLFTIYPRKKINLSEPAKGHKIYPYLLRDLEILYPNHAWSTDITYVRMPRGFAYLVAIIDLYSRAVLSWRLSNSLDVSFCTEALEEAIDIYGKPEIFNTDQGSQFTSEKFTGVLKKNGIQISMDGKGRATDNAYIERLWRTVKYEHIFLVSYETLWETRIGLRKWFEFYNKRRYHQSLDYGYPMEVYCNEIANSVEAEMEAAG